MLIYDPAIDIGHAVFRLMLIIRRANNRKIEIDRYRIIDFYMLYPSALSEFRMPSLPDRNFSELKRQAKSWENKYNKLGNKKMVFMQLSGIQRAAIDHLVSSGILDSKQAQIGYLARSDKALPEDFLNYLDEVEPINKNIVNFLWDFSLTHPLFGEGGLKERSKLMEYRYDPA